MASSLGGAFGVAISAAVYGAIAANGNLETAASIGIIVNVIFGIIAILSVIFLVPNNAGKTSNAKKNHLVILACCRIINNLECKTPHLVAFSINNEGMKK